MAVPSYKFADFELDSARFELRRNGRVLKLERIPLELLILLAEKDGSVVTRQEIVDRLWGKDVFVDTEHGINTAIRKIRQALKDDPDQPRFVQTITGKGYRFVAEKNGHAEPPQPMERRTPRPPSGPEVSGRSLAITDTAEIKPALFAPKTKLAIALALCLIAAALLVKFRTRLYPSTRASQIHSIAVLPLMNLSGDASQNYFADGMTDELITALAKNRNLRVVSRTSAMQYKGVQRPVRDIARELGVDGILEGSIERSPSRVHMTVQLIYAPTDSHVWAESYDRDLTQAYSLPEELSQTVAKEVKAATSPASPLRYIRPDAHDAYLRGLAFWFGDNVQGGLEYFEKAIQLQPDYAAAWSGLSNTYAVLAIGGEAPSSDVKARWESAARKALDLDDSLPEAHNCLAGWYLFYVWDWKRAEAESLRTLALDPHFAEGYHMHSYILTVTGRLAEAVEEQKKGTAIDPFARPWALGYAYYHTRQFEAAVSELRLRIAAQPTDPTCHQILADSYHALGLNKEAAQETEQTYLLLGEKESVAALQRAFQRGGFAAVADWEADVPWQANPKADARKYTSPYWRALDTARAGRKEQTLRLLEQAYSEHSPRIIFLQNEPAFDFLHSSPRYLSLVKKIGLPPAQ